MESILTDYSETLQFILQFLRNEGFQESESILLKEIQQKLPELLVETIAGSDVNTLEQPSSSEVDCIHEQVGMQLCMHLASELTMTFYSLT